VLAWRSIPTQVEVTAEDGAIVSLPMARWFMQEVSRIAMREGLSATDDYLEAFAWSEAMAREGSAQEILASVMEEQAERFGRAADGHPLAGQARYDGDGR
jgi:hypothetical protein